eukprot:scaffold14068_cov32-Attheya_sp.AAC.2
MSLANSKYKTLKQKGEWNAPTAEEEKILALEAEMSQMKKGAKRAAGKKPSPSPANKLGGQGDAKPNWLKHNRPPHQNEVNKPRNWNSLEYHWCHTDTGGKCAGIWRRHTPKECRESPPRRGILPRSQ